jgi:hypothetical protein
VLFFLVKINDKEIWVKYSYRDLEDNLVSIDLPLDEYCETAWRKYNRLLYFLEEELGLKLGKRINLKEDFPEVRKQLLHASGMMSRLSDNLVLKDSK